LLAKSCSDSILEKISKISGAPNSRGSKTDSSLVEVKGTSSTCVLLEVAFHDNASDVAWMEKNWDNIATAIADGIK
jgi:N-acetylmuramoyl-L-alanine amidase